MPAMAAHKVGAGARHPSRPALRGWGLAVSLIAHVAVVGSAATFFAHRAALTEPPPDYAVDLVFAPPPPEPAAAPVESTPAPVVAPPVEQASAPEPPRVTEEPVEEEFLPVPPPVPPAPPRPVTTPRRVSAPVAERPPAPTETAALTAAPFVPARPVSGMESDRPPRYPEAARRRGEQGRVVLQVDVSADGAPVDVTVAEGSGIPSLDAAALNAVRQWRFVPATRAGKPVAAVARVPVRFRLTD
jgi:protein TonB